MRKNRQKTVCRVKNLKITDISSNMGGEDWQNGYPSYNSPEDIKEIYRLVELIKKNHGELPPEEM